MAADSALHPSREFWLVTWHGVSLSGVLGSRGIGVFFANWLDQNDYHDDEKGFTASSRISIIVPRTKRLLSF